MSDKAKHNFRMLPGVKGTAKPIVDPAISAALAASARRSIRGDSAVGAALEWCQLFTDEDRFKLVVALISEMSEEQRTELKNLLTVQLNGATST